MAPRPVQVHVARILYRYKVPMLGAKKTFFMRQECMGPLMGHIYYQNDAGVKKFMHRLARISPDCPVVVPDALLCHQAWLQHQGFVPIDYDHISDELRCPERIEEAAWTLVNEMDVLRQARERYVSKDL